MKHTKLILAIAAFGFASSIFAADTIKIGSLNPYSGGSANNGTAVRDGQRLAVKDINAKGGVLGRQIELIEMDDEASSAKSIQNMENLLSKGIVAAASGVNTGVVKPYEAVLQKAKIPNVVPAATGTILTQLFKDAPEGNYTFRVVTPDSIQSAMMVQHIVAKGYKKVAILSDNTAYGQLGLKDLEANLAKNGITAVYKGEFGVKDTDMTAQLLKAKEAGADVLATYGIGPEVGHIADGNLKLGMNSPMVSSWTSSMSSFVDIAKKAGAEGNVSPQAFIEGFSNTSKGREFEKQYHVEYKNRPVMLAPTATAGGYDSILLIAEAIKQANSTDGTKIRDALEDLKGPIFGVISTYTKPFSKDDHEAVKPGSSRMAVWRDGKMILLTK